MLVPLLFTSVKSNHKRRGPEGFWQAAWHRVRVYSPQKLIGARLESSINTYMLKLLEHPVLQGEIAIIASEGCYEA